MKNIFIVIFFLAAVMSIFFISCSRHEVVNGIVVSELLKSASKKQNVDYVGLLKDAAEGSEKSIKQLALLRFYDASGYDHGAVIVDLIEIIGEDKFIKSLFQINQEQKHNVKAYIEVGLEYGNNVNIGAETIETAYPKIFTFLK